jgi:hypothetical protein
MRSRRALFTTALIVFSFQQATAAPPVAVRDQAVDLLTLAGGERLLGMLMGPPAALGPPGGTGPSRSETVVFLVERAWLQKRQAALYRQTTMDETKVRRDALDQLRVRLTEWRQRRAEPRVLAGFLDRRLADVEKQLAAANDAGRAAEPSQLLLIELPVKRVRQSFVQPADRRRLLGLAWEERLADVEELSAAALTDQLRERKVDTELAQPDISDRLPMLPQTDRQWSAKVAMVEFQILAKPHFQGSGSVLVRDDGGQQRPPIAELLGSLMQDQLGGVLGELLNDPLGKAAGGGRPQGDERRLAAIEKALSSAADDGLRGARVSYLEQDLQKHQVTVTDTFHAQMPDNAWQVVWRQTATVDARQAGKAGGAQLAEDPQIAEIAKSMKHLGLGANDDLLQTALGFGAATQQALGETGREFGHFLLMNTRSLTGPPMLLPETPAR